MTFWIIVQKKMGEKIDVAIIGAGIVGTTLRVGVDCCCFFLSLTSLIN